MWKRTIIKTIKMLSDSLLNCLCLLACLSVSYTHDDDDGDFFLSFLIHLFFSLLKVKVKANKVFLWSGSVLMRAMRCIFYINIVFIWINLWYLNLLTAYTIYLIWVHATFKKIKKFTDNCLWSNQVLYVCCNEWPSLFCFIYMSIT